MNDCDIGEDGVTVRSERFAAISAELARDRPADPQGDLLIFVYPRVIDCERTTMEIAGKFLGLDTENSLYS